MLIIQLTGLPGSGKSTLSEETARKIEEDGYKVEIIDGDDYRKILCKDLGFSKKDRNENIRRLGFVADTLRKHGIIVIIAAINPYESVREEIRNTYKNVFTVYVKCELNVLMKRDIKNLYKRATLPDDHPDKITNLSGINDPYETPGSPDLAIDTTSQKIKESVEKLYSFIKENIANPEMGSSQRENENN